MACIDIIKHLHEFIDKEVDKPQYFSIHMHLNHCDGCRQRYEFEKGIRNLVKKHTVNITAPAYLRSKIQRGLSSVDRENTHSTHNAITHTRKKIVTGQKTKQSWFSSRSFALAASVLLTIAIGIIYYNTTTTSIVDNAVKNHVVAVNNNLVFNESTSVVGNINEYLEKTLNTRLRNSSPLLGTNQIRVVGGIPVRFGKENSSCVIFDKGGNKLSLQTIHRDDFPIKNLEKIQLGSKEFYIGNRGRFHSVLWKEEGLAYCLTSDINTNELLRFAEALTSY